MQTSSVYLFRRNTKGNVKEEKKMINKHIEKMIKEININPKALEQYMQDVYAQGKEDGYNEARLKLMIQNKKEEK